jgi:hypothetical protein
MRSQVTCPPPQSRRKPIQRKNRWQFQKRAFVSSYSGDLSYYIEALSVIVAGDNFRFYFKKNCAKEVQVNPGILLLT